MRLPVGETGPADSCIGRLFNGTGNLVVWFVAHLYRINAFCNHLRYLNALTKWDIGFTPIVSCRHFVRNHKINQIDSEIHNLREISSKHNHCQGWQGPLKSTLLCCFGLS